jgi:hypothetical protein
VQHYIPASKGDNSMASDEELRLINEVDELESQLSHAGYPINPELSKFFYRSLENKSTAAERVPKWTKRVEDLRRRLERASASAAVSPVDANHDQQQNGAVPTSLKRRALPELKHVEERMRPLKKAKKNAYIENIDGSAPRMKSNHVEFVRFCVDELKKDPELTQASLIHCYKVANPDEDTGFTTSLFANGYITTAQLHGIACGTLPPPIALPGLPPRKKGENFARIQHADGGSRKRGRPNQLADMLSHREADAKCSSAQGSDGEPDR